MSLTLAARQCLTTAPEDYDYCWAKTLTLNVANDGRGRSMRLVENEDDWHFRQQIMRYGSGLHLTIDRQDELDKQLEYGLITLTDCPVHVYRQSFEFPRAYRWPDDRLDQLREAVQLLEHTEGVQLETLDGGLAYRLEIRGDCELFREAAASLSVFERQPERQPS